MWMHSNLPPTSYVRGFDLLPIVECALVRDGSKVGATIHSPMITYEAKAIRIIQKQHPMVNRNSYFSRSSTVAYCSAIWSRQNAKVYAE